MTTAALWTRHRPLARQVAAGFYLPGAERQDVEQEAMIGLWVAATRWDPERSSFRSFAETVIRRRLITLVRAALAGSQRPLTDSARVDQDGLELLAELPAPGTDPADVVASRQSLARIVAAVASLTELEREALADAVNGEPYAHDKTRDNAVYRARRKLRAAA